MRRNREDAFTKTCASSLPQGSRAILSKQHLTPDGTTLLQVPTSGGRRHSFLPALLGPADPRGNRGAGAAFLGIRRHRISRLDGSPGLADSSGSCPPDAVVSGFKAVRTSSAGRVVADVYGTEPLRGHV